MRPFLTPPFLSPRDGKDFAYFFKQNLFLLARLADTAGTNQYEMVDIQVSYLGEIFVNIKVSDEKLFHYRVI